MKPTFTTYQVVVSAVLAVSVLTTSDNLQRRKRNNNQDYFLPGRSHFPIGYVAPPPNFEATLTHLPHRDWRYDQSPHHDVSHPNPNYHMRHQERNYPASNIHPDFRLHPYADKNYFYTTRAPLPHQYQNYNPYVTVNERKNESSHLQNGNVNGHHDQNSKDPSLSISHLKPEQLLQQQHHLQQQRQQQKFHEPHEHNKKHPEEMEYKFQQDYQDQTVYENHGEQLEDQGAKLPHAHQVGQPPDVLEAAEVSSHEYDYVAHMLQYESLENLSTTSSLPAFEDKSRKSLSDIEHQDNHHDQKTSEGRPANLASLLANEAAIGLKIQNPRTENNITNSQNRTVNDTLSITRTSVPEYIKPLAGGGEYYDELYDEFVDMYYNPETTDSNEKDLTENTEANLHMAKKTVLDDKKQNLNNKTESETSHIARDLLTSTKTLTIQKETQSTASNTTPYTASKATTSSLTTFPLVPSATTAKSTPKKFIVTRKTQTTTAKTEKIKVTSTTTSPRGRRQISLSEVLQELGLSLPQFLGTLKTHGSSLKDFTTKLQTKSLSKAEFRRAKGNVKIVLEILEGSSNSKVNNKNFVQPTSTTSKLIEQTTTKLQITTPSTNSNRTSSIITKTITNKEVTDMITTEDKKPSVFGSRPSGISLLKPDTEAEESEEVKNQTSIPLLNPPKTIELDIAKLMKEKGISAAGILQEFKTMFNISEAIFSNSKKNESESITPAPGTKAKTTVFSKLYRKGVERHRTFRPLSYEGGSRNIHRGIVNSRLGSTARPTLRPPYVPRAPILNHEPSNVNSRQFFNTEKNTILVGHSEDTPISKIRNEESGDADEKELYNYNLVKHNQDSMHMSTKSAIMAAGILGGVALSVFIAIFIVVKYRSHMHRRRRRIPLALPSDSSSSSLPPIYASRNVYSKECYQTSGFWTTLKKRFDPYSPSSSPMSM